MSTTLSSATGHGEGDRLSVTATSANIVAFVGEDENGVLGWASQAFMDLLKPHGFAGHVVNLGRPDCPERIRDILAQGVLFAWGCAGVGSDLKANGLCLWDHFRIPFISVMADTPCQKPANHRQTSAYVANGYLFDDWLNMQRRLIRSPQISSMLPLGMIDNPARDVVRWSDRQHRMVFVKTCCAPEYHRARWAEWPKRFRAVLEDASSAVLAGGVGDITDIVLRALDHHNLYIEQRPDILFGLMTHVDVYVRDCRSTAMVAGLLDLPVDIIGRGWEHMSGLGGRARFHAPLAATTLFGLYANTQFLVNTMPNFSTRTHERVTSGFGAKCCVITNENADMRTMFESVPGYFGVDTAATDLAERLAEIYHSEERYDDRLQPAHDLMHATFSGEAFVCGMIELANEVKIAAGSAFANFR